MKVNVKATIDIEVEFDENNPDFKVVWDVYTKMIDPDATYEDMSKSIVHQILNGYDDLEGVGCVKFNSEAQIKYHTTPPEVIEHPINVVCSGYDGGWWFFDMEASVLDER